MHRYKGGRNEVGGTLHWAPNSDLDAFWRTNGVRYMTRGDYSDDFHTFGMEWSDSYIYTWVDSRLAVCFILVTIYENYDKSLTLNRSNLCMFRLGKSTGQCTTEANLPL
jgi:hypothetical protein